MTYFLTALFMFFVFWRPQEWLWPWLFGWPLLDLVVGVAVLTLIMELHERRLRFAKENPHVSLLVGVFFAALLSHVAHTYFVGLIETIPNIFKLCFFTILLVVTLDRPSRLRFMVRIFVAMVCLMAVHAIMQERTGVGFAGSYPYYVGASLTKPAHTRSLFFGIFGDPNDLGQILATAVPFSFILFKRKSFWAFLVGCAVAWLLIQGLLTTHSRGAQVALAATGAVMFVLVMPSRWTPTLLVILVISALLLCPLSAGYLDTSAHDRVVFWGLANEYFKRNPFFGIGFGMFWMVASDRASHNAFVEVYTTTGILGYWFWYTILQLGVMGCWRTRTALERVKDPEAAWLRRFAGLAVASMTAFAVSSYFLSRGFLFPFFFLFALLGVVPFVAQSYLPEKAPRLINVNRDVYWLGSFGTAASILYIYFSIVLLNKAFYG